MIFKALLSKLSETVKNMKLLNYLKLKIINLSNILLPFKNYTISYYFSRYGNNLQQIANGIIFANKNQSNFYVSNHNKINSFKIINNEINDKFSFFKKKYRFFYFDNSFDLPSDSVSVSEFYDAMEDVFKNSIKANISFLSNNIPKENELIIHVRSGDIFTNFKKDYYQNPLIYYLDIIKKFESVIVVTSEEKNNPVIEHLANIENVKIQSSSLENDFNTIFNAVNLATSGVGTFPIAAALMSENLKNLYYTNLYLKEHLNPKMIKNPKINHYEFHIEEDYKKRYSKNYELEKLILNSGINIQKPKMF